MRDKKKIILPFILLSAIIMTNCATGTFFELLPSDESTAVVYFYRPRLLFNISFNIYIVVDRQKIADLPVESYTYIITDKDEISLFIAQNFMNTHSYVKAVKLKVKGGRSYYFRLRVGDQPSSEPLVEKIEENDALEEIEKMRLIKQDKIFID